MNFLSLDITIKYIDINRKEWMNMKKLMMGTYSYNDDTYNFNFYNDLTSVDKLRFVNSVVDLLVDGENYNYIIKDLIFDFFLIDIMTTDIDTDKFKSSTSFVEDVESFLDETNIVDIIKANARVGLIQELKNAVDLNVEYKTHIHTNPLSESLASLINTIEKKVNEVDLSSMKEMAEMLSGMTGELTPESIVKAYMDTDMHKKNLKEIEKSKNK